MPRQTIDKPAGALVLLILVSACGGWTGTFNIGGRSVPIRPKGTRGDLMSSRSERYLANAEKCQQVADAADTSGIKRLYGGLASQWRQLAEEADWTDQIGSPALSVKIRHAHTLRKIDKAEGATRELVALA